MAEGVYRGQGQRPYPVPAPRTGAFHLAALMAKVLARGQGTPEIDRREAKARAKRKQERLDRRDGRRRRRAQG